MDFDYLTVVSMGAVASASILIIATLGLAVIFGLMGVINLAHGEFIMFGAYATLVATRSGIPFPLAICIATILTALFGAAIERIIIRHLYGRILDTLLVTWSISLILYQVAVLIFGTVTPGIGMPLGNIKIGQYSMSVYMLFLILVALIVTVGTYLLLTRTRYGIMARASIQDPEIATAMGIEASRINTITFAFGAALAGFAGGILLPAVPATPNMGFAFVTKAFLTVVVAGPVALTGSVVAGGILGVIASVTASFWTTVLGDIFFFLATIGILRLFPLGISQRWRLKL